MLNYAKAIGANTDILSAQAFIFERDDPAESSQELLIVVITGVGDEAFTLIRKVGLDIQDYFFEDFESINKSFENLCQNLKAELSSLEQLSVGLGFIKNGTLYLEKINDFSVLLLRKNNKIELTGGLEDQKLISGTLEENDKILFLSPVLTAEKNGRDQLITNLFQSDVENLEFELESFIQQNPKTDPIAVVLIENLPEEIPEPAESKEDWVDDRRNELGVKPVKIAGAHHKTSYIWIILALIQKIPLWPTSKRKILAILAVFIVVIAIGINMFLGNLKKNNQFKAKIAQTQQQYDQAIALKDSDPNQSKSLLAAAKSNLKQAETIKPNDNQAKALEQKLNEGSFLILKQYNQNDFPVFLDLNLIKDNFTASRLSMSLGKIAVLDTNTKSLVAIDIAGKQPQILAGPQQLGDVQFASINGDYVYVFSKDKGVLKVDAGNGKTGPGVSPDTQWLKIVDILGFANNAYLLDEFSNQIWKYIATDSGFSARNQYLEIGETADFAAARNLQIDGSVWILKSDNTILKYTQGAKDFFQINPVDPPLDKIKSFYIADDTDNIYFLDNENSRVVVANKKGEYQAQYSGDKFRTANDLLVDEKGKKMYLLGEGKIYQIDLR